ncbi:hypothetical protein QWZ16_06740 [Vibrio ostreicida]|uniref:Transposase n=1 Tax=Vibrio ostreicida TaxID=526588 RepID=A0ABT8BTE2_9VIBR|nr:hypothetical protein [Vibrio ostreicida]MDN3609397.1 hypothetical protein [Vibrio ostreicida]
MHEKFNADMTPKRDRSGEINVKPSQQFSVKRCNTEQVSSVMHSMITEYHRKYV